MSKTKYYRFCDSCRKSYTGPDGVLELSWDAKESRSSMFNYYGDGWLVEWKLCPECTTRATRALTETLGRTPHIRYEGSTGKSEKGC